MHDNMGTFQVVIVPVKTRLLPCRWVYSLKTSNENEVTRFKARTVVWGNMQRPGIDFKETFSPTVRAEQIRLMIAVGARVHGERLRKCADPQVAVLSISDVLSVGDVKDAYLNSRLEEDNVLTELPPGFESELSVPDGFKVAARQVRAHPGLRQSGRAWFRNNRARLLERGFIQSEVAPCIFFKDTVCGGFIAVGVFVDDMLALNASANSLAFKELADSLKEHYVITHQDLDKFLGVQFEIGKTGIRMHLTQYITGILARFEMSECRVKRNPESSRDDPITAPDETMLNRKDILLYQEMTGTLLFCVTMCRPDLAHSVGMLARRMSKPRVRDHVAACRVFRYLQGTKDLGILFKYKEDSKHPGLVAYADSDWGADTEGRRSTSGYVVMFNGAPVSWQSSMQSIVALSTCEAEYIAASDAAREVYYMREVASFIRNPQPGPTVLYEDNQGAFQLFENPVHHKRTKHIDVKYHYIRAAQENGVIKVEKIHTDLNHADIMTKAATTVTFRRHVDALMQPAVQPAG